MAITCKEIAEQLGVSRQAVYSVLGDKAVCHVSPEKREKILFLARSYHYRPNHAAVRLNGAPSRSIGLVADGLNRVAGQRAMRIAQRLGAEGYDVQTVYFLSDAQGHRVLNDFVSAGMEGVIYPNYFLGDVRQEDLGIPAVEYGGEIVADYALGAEMMTRHLIEDHHHRRILHIATELEESAVPKRRGYCRALERAGFEALPTLTTLGNRRFPEELGSELNRGVTALVVSGDVLAAQLIYYLRRLGVRVPEEVAVTGFDALGDQPEISSVADPVEGTALAVVDLLLQKMRNRTLAATEPRLIPPTLYLSRSCGCPAAMKVDFNYQYSMQYNK